MGAINNDAPKYPRITVRLQGSDGNAFAVIGKVRKALRRAQVGEQAIKAFTDEATSGDYNHLIGTCMRWVNVE